MMNPLPDFRRIDPRAKTLWRIGNAIGFGILVLGFGAVGLITTLNEVPVAPLIFWGISGFWLAWGLFLVFRYPDLAYEKSGWALEENVLWIRSGVWWQVTQLLPLSRLQHIDLKRGPLERRMGLATLSLHTAGTHAATITLSGLSVEDAEHLRDTLVAAGGDDGV